MSKINNRAIGKLDEAIAIMSKNGKAHLNEAGIKFARQLQSIVQERSNFTIAIGGKQDTVSPDGLRISKTRVSFGGKENLGMTLCHMGMDDEDYDLLDDEGDRLHVEIAAVQDA